MLNSETTDSRNFTSLLQDLNLNQLIREPTHPYPTPALLDLALTNVHAVPDVRVLPDLLADHYPIIIRPSFKRSRQPPPVIYSRPWHRVDWNAFSLDILNANWDSFYLASDVNTKLSHLMSVWGAIVRSTVRRRLALFGAPAVRGCVTVSEGGHGGA